MKSVRLLTTLILALVTAGCGSQAEDRKPERKSSDVNMRQAAEKADAVMQQTLSGVVPRLRWNHGPSNDRICTDFKNDATGTGRVRRRIAIMTVVSAERRGSLLGVVERDWKARGYRITSVDTDPDLPAIFASTPDGFQMRVAVGGRGQFFLSITTPCFTQSPVPAPAPGPNTPHRTGGYPQPPDIHDHFWSSRDPLPASSPSTP